MVLHGRGTEGGVDREKVLECLGCQTIRDQRGPLRFHEEQFGSGWLSQQRREWAERRGLVTLAGTLIQAGTGQHDRAKEGAERARLLPFGPQGSAAVVTLGTGRHKGGGLLGHQGLLQRYQELLGFRQRQAEVLNALAVLVEG